MISLYLYETNQINELNIFICKALLGTPTEETWPGVSSICNYIEAFNPPIVSKVFIFYF